ncbi:tetratricopeptide repeat protein [Pseudooceanicola sp. 502str34]|uniref:tetratricopeptide repeat protein n=1 Tax=Maritimibacter alkaliphilus TaxID=404236 RepID=UPI001C975BF0|nr:tetratricopeptide repeat protein [Maritimibacter alkaliphilus]MBY6092740.1 tetratricopeptide repeat protein [Maritimibacter alkaliphilus]
MSDTDSFIDEVTEEVRRDRLFALLKRYGWIAILIVLVIVGGAAWREYSRATQTRQAQDLGEALLAALDQDTPESRVAALDAVVVDSAGGRALRAFLKASEAAEAGDTAAAADALEALADEQDLPMVYRRVAAFKALGLQAGTMSPADRRAGYEALQGGAADFRLLAQEQIALTYIEEGDTAAAIEELRAIQSDAEVSSGLRRRVTQLIVALGEPASASETDNG